MKTLIFCNVINLIIFLVTKNKQTYNLKKLKLFGIIVVDDDDSLDLDNIIFMETEEARGNDSTLNCIIHIYT